mmetsp:Transcript_115959/g.328168  ORF Transcript_115959/g.328168 Transcript_115959/m.328168 type:complete len:202 (-) Transcript_115959:293-898(-)
MRVLQRQVHEHRRRRPRRCVPLDNMYRPVRPSEAVVLLHEASVAWRGGSICAVVRAVGKQPFAAKLPGSHRAPVFLHHLEQRARLAVCKRNVARGDRCAFVRVFAALRPSVDHLAELFAIARGRIEMVLGATEEAIRLLKTAPDGRRRRAPLAQMPFPNMVTVVTRLAQAFWQHREAQISHFRVLEVIADVQELVWRPADK